MEVFNIALATDCRLDDDFFKIIEANAGRKNLSTYLIYPYNLDETLSKVENNQISFSALYDRASDTSFQFRNLYPLLAKNQCYYLVNLDNQKTAADKSIMHTYFVENNINVPKTVILPAYSEQKILNVSERDFNALNRPFVIKPSLHTGAGSGVYLNAYTLPEIEQRRKQFPDDKYLIQEKIYPREIYLKRFWCRSFYVCGTVITTWWNDYRHRYEVLSDNDQIRLDLDKIQEIMHRIHHICKLHFFSTELAITESNKIYAIDYVNEICDMRLKSTYPDGVPDEIVEQIAEKIVAHIYISITDNNNMA